MHLGPIWALSNCNSQSCSARAQLMVPTNTSAVSACCPQACLMPANLFHVQAQADLLAGLLCLPAACRLAHSMQTCFMCKLSLICLMAKYRNALTRCCVLAAPPPPLPCPDVPPDATYSCAEQVQNLISLSLELLARRSFMTVDPSKSRCFRKQIATNSG